MARGSTSRSGSGSSQRRNAFSGNNVQTVEKVQKAIERQWQTLPQGARAFLLETPLDSLDLRALAKFWSSPFLVEYTRGRSIPGVMRDASYSLALSYLRLGRVRDARALMLNGSFIMECMDTPIETIIQWCRKDANSPEARIYGHALEKKAPQAIEVFLQKMQRMFHGSSQKAVVDILGKSGDDSGNSGKKRRKSSSKTSEETQIQLILADDENTEDRHVLNIGSSTTLKMVFNDYAEKRGVSLRSLRFSHNGKTLFLSSAGNRTPDELNMGDQDVITVRNTNNDASQENSDSSSKEKKKPTTKHVRKHGNSTKKTKGKRKKEQSKQVELVKTLEDYKAHHSKLLTKLHEEVQPRLKEIRNRLNSLDLERQPPKKKRSKKKKKKGEGNAGGQLVLPDSGASGKAGKPHFVVQVGEVQNLYKTTKSSRQKGSPCDTSATLDLHGCTRDEALAKLDATLETWVDAAMRGSYPFVIPAKIVCGCGGQVLSETVERWIRNRAQVANCPKGMF